MSELPPELSRLVAAGRRKLAPSAGDRERLRHRVFLAVGVIAATAPIQASAASAVAASSSGFAAGSAAAGGLSAIKVLVGSLAAVGIAGGGYTGFKALSDEPAASPPAIHERARLVIGEPETPSIPLRLTEAEETVEDPSPEALVEPQIVQPRRRPVTTRRTDATEAPAESSEEPVVGAVESSQMGGPEPVVHTEDDASEPNEALGRELALLDKARAASSFCQTSRALTLLGRYDLEHPEGQLAHEAAFLRIVVLCRAGDSGLARAHAMSFAKRFKTSPLNARVSRVCELPEAKEGCHEGH